MDKKTLKIMRIIFYSIMIIVGLFLIVWGFIMNLPLIIGVNNGIVNALVVGMLLIGGALYMYNEDNKN